jgi:hypothetical protein
MCTSFTRRVSSRFGLSAYYILEIAIFLWVRSRIQGEVRVAVVRLTFQYACQAGTANPLFARGRDNDTRCRERFGDGGVCWDLDFLP